MFLIYVDKGDEFFFKLEIHKFTNFYLKSIFFILGTIQLSFKNYNNNIFFIFIDIYLKTPFNIELLTLVDNFIFKNKIFNLKRKNYLTIFFL